MYNTATGIAHAETDLKDHLGSTRVVYSVENGLLRLKQVNSYYPFSLNIKELTLNDGREMQGYNKNEYTYNGKMQQDEMNLGRLDYGARFYDAVLGRWHSVDPLAEKYRRWSPYNYCVDNPMRFVDPDGVGLGDPPYLYVFNSEQNAITGETLGEFANNNIVQDVLGIAGGALTTVFGGFPGWVLGPTSTGLSFGKLIMHLNPDKFDQKKVDKCPSSGTGVVLGAFSETSGGSFEGGANLGDLAQGSTEFGLGFPIKSTMQGTSQTFTLINILPATIKVFTKSNDDIKSCSTSKTSGNATENEDINSLSSQPVHPLAPKTVERVVESWINYR